MLRSYESSLASNIHCLNMMLISQIQPSNALIALRSDHHPSLYGLFGMIAFEL
jgi:hypothetical protein